MSADSKAAYEAYLDGLVLAAHRERSWWHRAFAGGKFGPRHCTSCSRIALAVTVALTAPYQPDGDR